MERTISEDVFTKLYHAKERELVYTKHAIKQAKKRDIISDQDGTISKFEKDLKENKPYKVVEQDSEDANERKFKAYYQDPAGGFMVYIVVLNKRTRLISIYRTSKKLQKDMYHFERSWVQKR